MVQWRVMSFTEKGKSKEKNYIFIGFVVNVWQKKNHSIVIILQLK